ncbi:hypothetical protein AB0M80_43865 [Amycolatopsis sp. NPDC051045]|uniref:hypothetical protein n=1 Tax=Amycolatopsis sp. NPDC051045 TaxID=3156922 RepID=UPI00344226B9
MIDATSEAVAKTIMPKLHQLSRPHVQFGVTVTSDLATSKATSGRGRTADVAFTDVVGTISALAGAASAAAAWRAALASGKAARESREALAYATRPYLALSTERDDQPDSTTTETVGIRNTAGFPAVDVQVAVHDSKGRRVGAGEIPFMEGQTPNSWSGPEIPLKIELPNLALLLNVGDSRTITATVRSSDRQRFLRWEQRITLKRTVVPPTEHDHRMLIHVDNFEIEEPRTIGKAS